MVGRVLYGLVFVAGVPLILIGWAVALERVTVMPRVHWPLPGALGVCGGLGLMAWSWWVLWRDARALPMNAFPPRRRVSRGPYAWVAHPIYAGFGLSWVGGCLCVGSGAGLWIVGPILVLAMAALVIGYEADATRARLGSAEHPPRVAFAGISGERPTAWQRASVYILVLLPWSVVYEAVGHLPVPGAVEAFMPGERAWPVYAGTAPLYSSVYALVLAAPLLCRSRCVLRRFCEAGVVATVVAVIMYLTVPLVSPPRDSSGGGLGGMLLALERADGLAGRVAFPSFHVAWAVIAACACASRGWRWGLLVWLWAVATMVSCATTGMHALVDVSAGLLLGVAAWRWRQITLVLAGWAQRVCNSWREWRIGPVRIINHSLYAGAAACLGVVIAGRLAGDAAVPWIGAVGLAAMVGGAVWGQVFVKRPTSSRPFGYFGAVLGAVAGLLAGWVAGVADWGVAAALSTAAPFIQTVGRVRCLVQGCCHGRPTTGWLAIRYEHPMTRVCRASGLCGVPVHATPLYSMGGNLVIGLLLLRLWSIGASAGLIVGGYLILAGLLRFVEEHFRGEPHTRVVAGLRIYQWFAVGLVVAGMGVSVLRTGSATAHADGSPALWAWAVGLGVAWGAAMGVDFPESGRRFARLT